MRKIIDFILMIINSIIPKNNNKIIFSSMPDYSDNPKALYEYINKNYFNDYELIWICYNYDARKKLNEMGIKAFDRKELKGIYHTLTSRYIVSSHYNLLSVKGKGQIYVNLWHGMPLKTMGFLENKVNKNVDINDKSMKKNKKEIDKIDYMSSTSKIMKLALAGCFYIDPRKILVLGQSRNDYLFESKDNAIDKISLLLPDVNIKNYKKIIIYMPTLRKGMGGENGYFDQNNVMNLLNYDKNKLEEYLKKNNYLLIGKLHPAEETKFSDLDGDNIKIIKSNEMINKLVTVNEIIGGCDLLITDYSSVYFDYLNLDRPIIFINTDENIYKDERGFIFDNDDEWRPGPKIKRLEYLIEEIDKSLKTKEYYKKERTLINNMVNKYNDNNSSKRIFEEIFLKYK